MITRRFKINVMPVADARKRAGRGPGNCPGATTSSNLTLAARWTNLWFVLNKREACSTMKLVKICKACAARHITNHWDSRLTADFAARVVDSELSLTFLQQPGFLQKLLRHRPHLLVLDINRIVHRLHGLV